MYNHQPTILGEVIMEQIIKTDMGYGIFNWTEGLKVSIPKPALNTDAQVLEYCLHLENLGLRLNDESLLLQADEIMEDFCNKIQYSRCR